MPNLKDVIHAWAADPDAGPFIPRSELAETSKQVTDEWWRMLVEEPVGMPTPPHIASMWEIPATMGRVENGEPIVTATCSRCQTPNSQCVQRLAPDSSERGSDTYVLECLPCVTGGSIVRNGAARWVYPTSFNPNSVFSRLLDPRENLTATGAMIEDANRLRPRFEDYADVNIRENTVGMVLDGREVARIENVEIPAGSPDPDADRAYYMDPRMFTPNPILQGRPVPEATANITRMPCGCMQSSCERCGPWLREYDTSADLHNPSDEQWVAASLPELGRGLDDLVDIQRRFNAIEGENLSSMRENRPLDAAVFANPSVPESDLSHR